MSGPLVSRWRAQLGVAALGLAMVVWGAVSLMEPSAGGGGSAEPGSGPAAAGALQPEALRWGLPDDPFLGFVEIPEGPFTMGSDPSRDPLAFDVEGWGPSGGTGTVDLPRFHLARTEVTVAQYALFVGATGRTVADSTLMAPGDHPVTWVSWTDALAYARWLDGELRSNPQAAQGLSAILDAGFRVDLPTEAQWEKGARGADGRIYPWGDSISAGPANFAAGGTRPVATPPCPSCAHGLADMAGNAWEWTRSPWQPYPYTEADDRTDVATDALWVMRGGGFGDPPQLIRAASRGAADPGARRPFIGFRVALVGG